MLVPDEQLLEERGADPAGCGALRSQVGCAVLGLVIEKPSHGYEIGQRFERRFGEFLSVGRSSIYAALRSLMEGELIEKMCCRSGSLGLSGVVERLLMEERRRMIDAQLAWTTYARAELRAVRAGSGEGDDRR